MYTPLILSLFQGTGSCVPTLGLEKGREVDVTNTYDYEVSC